MRALLSPATFLSAAVLFGATPVRADDYTAAAAAVARGVSAYQTKDYAAFLTEMARANELRSDHPTYRYYLATAQALAGNAEAAARTLSEVASWGLTLAAEKQREFDAVRNDAAVQSAFAALRRNQAPHGEVTLRIALPAKGGLYEGLAEDSRSQQLYLSDLHHARILHIDQAGRSRVFATLTHRGFGCGGLAIDAERNLLWVASPALPEVAGFEEELTGQSQLLALSLTDGSLRRRVAIPAEDGVSRTVVDLLVAPDGAVYAPDSASPVVWRVLPESSVAEVFATIDRPGPRHSLQGAALSPDGAYLLVSDYSTGLHRIHLQDRRIDFLGTPTDAIGTAIGIDGIAVSGDTMLAVQNGVSPARLLHIRLRADGQPLEAQVVASGLPELLDPTLVTATPAGFLLIGSAGWPRFGAQSSAEPADRVAHIVEVSTTR